MLISIHGTHFITIALFYISASFFLLLILSTIFAALYHRIIYKRFRRPRYAAAYKPRCSIIIPCKGLVKGLEQNLESFLNLDYPVYEVLYAIESSDDPSAETIARIVARNPNKAKLVVAGLAHKCAQKNFNQLAAIQQANNPEVYVFADNDIGPRPDWLSEIVLPLSNPGITATSGFRWLISSRSRLRENVQAFQSNLLYILFSTVATFSKLSLLWGGSMAIRKEEFESLGVAQRWAETAVDDFTLSKLVMNAHKRAVLVPTCVTPSDDSLQSLGQAVQWFERQTMFLKAYHKKTWAFLAMPLVASLFISIVWLPLSFVVASVSPLSFFAIGGGAGVAFISLGIIHALMYPLIEKMPGYLSFVVYFPLSAFCTIAGALKTLFTNTISWGGIKYKLNFNGTVASVERPAA